MKVGDLVRWNHPISRHRDIGLVVPGWLTGHAVDEDIVYIRWIKTPEHSGGYAKKHRYLELISEAG